MKQRDSLKILLVDWSSWRLRSSCLSVTIHAREYGLARRQRSRVVRPVRQSTAEQHARLARGLALSEQLVNSRGVNDQDASSGDPRGSTSLWWSGGEMRVTRGQRMHERDKLTMAMMYDMIGACSSVLWDRWVRLFYGWRDRERFQARSCELVILGSTTNIFDHGWQVGWRKESFIKFCEVNRSSSVVPWYSLALDQSVERSGNKDTGWLIFPSSRKIFWH